MLKGPRRIVLPTIVLLIAGCASGDDTTAEETGATEEPTTATTEAATTSSTTNAAEETTTTAPGPDGTVLGANTLDIGEPWDLLWFSDSTGWGVAEEWAEQIGEDLGVEVAVNDRSEGGLPATIVLDVITGGAGDEYPIPGRFRSVDARAQEWVAEAEIIVIHGNPLWSGATDDMETCFSTSTVRRDPPVRYSAEDFAPYKDVLRSIYEVVFELRDGAPTIVRAIDSYNPVIADWREAGIEAECTAVWEMYSQTIHEAAAEYRVPTASMFDAFNGPAHDEDPREKGYIGHDGRHTTEEGQREMVDVLAGLGYEPIPPSE